MAVPLDVQEGEEFLLDQQGATPVSSYLESSRGKRCVVYLVNGQRQEFDDNGFIVQDLGFRYLRARMMIMVDVDGLAPEAIGRLMQGSRQGFYRGAVFEAITKRIIATLKDDPDLLRLEEEAEEAVSELSAGDEKVKQTLDQLIELAPRQGPRLRRRRRRRSGDSKQRRARLQDGEQGWRRDAAAAGHRPGRRLSCSDVAACVRRSSACVPT